MRITSQTIAHYRILGELREDGIGVIYKAHDDPKKEILVIF